MLREQASVLMKKEGWRKAAVLSTCTLFHTHTHSPSPVGCRGESICLWMRVRRVVCPGRADRFALFCSAKPLPASNTPWHTHTHTHTHTDGDTLKHIEEETRIHKHAHRCDASPRGQNSEHFCHRDVILDVPHRNEPCCVSRWVCIRLYGLCVRETERLKGGGDQV